MNLQRSLFIKLNPNDNVVVATASLGLGSKIDGIDVCDSVLPGHKVAVQSIAVGDAVLKYGQVIGYAKEAIDPGQHVHTHNLEFRPSAPEHHVASGVKNIDSDTGIAKRTFEGYDRGGGRFGTRNFIAILTSVNCSATAARNIASHFSDKSLSQYSNVDGVVSFTHSTGCGMDADGDGSTLR